MRKVNDDQIFNAGSWFGDARRKEKDEEKEKRYAKARYSCLLISSLLEEKKQISQGKDSDLSYVANWNLELWPENPEKGVFLRIYATEHGSKKAQRDLYDGSDRMIDQDGVRLVPRDPAVEAYLLYEGAQQGNRSCMERLIQALDEGTLFSQNYAEAAYWHKRWAESMAAADEPYEGRNQELIKKRKGNFWLDGMLGQAQTELSGELPKPGLVKPHYTEAMAKLETVRSFFEKRTALELELDNRWAEELLNTLPGKFGSEEKGFFGNPYHKPEKALKAFESADRTVREKLKESEKNRYQEIAKLEDAIEAELTHLGLQAPYKTASGVSYLYYHSMIQGTETLAETVEHMEPCWQAEKETPEKRFSMPEWLLSYYGADADWAEIAWNCYRDKSHDYNRLLALLSAFYVYQKEYSPSPETDWREPLDVKRAAEAFAGSRDSRLQRLAVICYQWVVTFCEMIVEETYSSWEMMEKGGGLEDAEAAYELCEIYGEIFGDAYESKKWGKYCLKKRLYHPKMSYWAARHPKDYCSNMVEQRNYASVAAEHGVTGAKGLMEALDRNIQYQEEQKAAARRAIEEEIRSQMLEYEDYLDSQERTWNELAHGSFMTDMERQLRGYVSRDIAGTLAYIRSENKAKYEKALREAAERNLSSRS